VTNKKRVAILGCTGSIGCQTLSVIKENQEFFQVEVLSANSSAELLIKQAIEFKPNAVVIGDESKYQLVKDSLWNYDVKVFAGEKALEQVVQMDTVDIVVTALMGYAGLKPTIAAIDAGKPIAIANKETLVVAGELVTKHAKAKGVNIYPVDSEHSAIFQCLAGEFHNPIEKIYLTASGGPFRGWDKKRLSSVTKQQALKHPNWTMGAKITIDSASLMNKGLEVIEAKWLFGLSADQIDVIVHPQSIIHSIVQFQDGSMKAQMGLPDMKLPIQYALGYPNRLPNKFPRFDFLNFPSLTFEKPDYENFENLQMAFDAMKKAGNMPCILNAANEIAVEAFLNEKIKFLEISELINNCMSKATFVLSPTLEDYVNSDHETRILAKEMF
jgi:1-deoxy-D-xylulose-5-phosphate reductoisomerase